MDVDKLITAISTINWHYYNDEFYYPERVSISLLALAYADQELKEGIYLRADENYEKVNLLLNAKISSDVLFAIGNNHRGTYYPVVREALPFIIQIALHGNHIVAINCAINILIDLYYFCSDDGSKELESFVKETIRTTIKENKSYFQQLSIEDPRHKSLIGSVMGIIDDSKCSDDDTEEKFKGFLINLKRDVKEKYNLNLIISNPFEVPSQGVNGSAEQDSPSP